MKKISSIEILQFISVILGIIMTVIACIFTDNLNRIARIITILLFLSFTVIIPSLKSIHKSAIKFLFVLLILFSVVLIGYVVLETTGTLEKIHSFDHLKNMILKTKHWGIIVYLFLTVFQVVVLPIPSALIILIGVAIYGPLWSFVLTTAGTYVGSIIAFWMGKSFGKKIVAWIIGDEATDKYSELIYQKGKFMFALMLLFPMFPDDILCMVAGITDMSYKFFIVTVALTRPVMIAATCFLGSGEIIPFTGWGIPVWIGLFLLGVGLFFVFNKIKNKFFDRKESKVESFSKMFAFEASTDVDNSKITTKNSANIDKK